ncbi:Acyl-CoA dehydrogenase-like protein, partial [Burkholderia sp. TJI49]
MRARTGRRAIATAARLHPLAATLKPPLDRHTRIGCDNPLPAAQQSAFGYQKSMFPGQRKTLNTLLIRQQRGPQHRSARCGHHTFIAMTVLSAPPRAADLPRTIAPSRDDEPGQPGARQTAERLAAGFARTAAERDLKGGTPKAERDLLRASGLLALSIPAAYG